MITKQNSFGYIGGTILDIMQNIQFYTDADTWGFLAASLVDETSNENNKRYQVYTEVLRRTFINHYQVFGNRENRAIFVKPTNRLADSERILENYEKIFAETN